MIKLRDVLADERTCDLEYGGETAKVTYRPAALTPAVEEQLRTSVDDGRPTDGFLALLGALLIGWDVVDDDGQQIPTDVDTLRTMPSRFLGAVLRAVMEDSRPGEPAASSAGG